MAYFAASTDPAETNARFAESLGLDYPILSDPTGETARAWGVAMPGLGFARRWTFYVDADGVIRAIDKDVDAAKAGRDVARRLEELGLARK